MSPMSPSGLRAERFERTITKEVGCQYLLYVPPEYAQDNAKKWPLLLFLHGAGERGNDVQRVKTHGPPKLIRQGKDLPFIVVAPLCPADEWWSVDVLNALLDEVVETGRIDEDRVYCTGLSMGGYGTWELAFHYPDRFAAIIPICGGGESRRHRIDRLKHLPVWCFHGSDDEIVLLDESQRIVDKLREAGGNVRFTVYEGVGHDSWTQTYDNPEIYEWLLSHRRGQR